MQKLDYQNSIIDYVNSKHFCWYGHVRRMEEDRLPTQILDWIPEGRRRRGKPVTWMGGISGVMQQRKLEEGDWEDGEVWRKRIWTQEDA